MHWYWVWLPLVLIRWFLRDWKPRAESPPQESRPVSVNVAAMDQLDRRMAAAGERYAAQLPAAGAKLKLWFNRLCAVACILFAIAGVIGILIAIGAILFLLSALAGF